ncbi:MAG: hypothetical protein WBD07_03870 [Vicinamibacterales bacterium]
MLCEQSAPVFDVLSHPPLDGLSVELADVDRLLGCGGGHELVASRFAQLQFCQKPLEWAARRDGLRQVPDLALDVLEAQPLAVQFSRERLRRELGEHAVDDRHDDGRPEYLAAERGQDGVVDAFHRQLQAVPAHRRPAFVIREAAVRVRPRALVTPAHDAQAAAADSAACEAREEVRRVDVVPPAAERAAASADQVLANAVEATVRRLPLVIRDDA